MKKTIRKLFAGILSVVIILTAVPVVFAEEAVLPEPSPAEFSVVSVKGVPDGIVTIEVRISENSQLAAAGLELNYDSSKMNVVNSQIGDVFASGMTAINANVSDKIIVSYASMEPLIAGGTVFSVDFKVIGEETEYNEQLDLSLDVTELVDVKNQAMMSSSNDGSVNVVKLLYGDINFDNKISVTDALMILSATTGEITLDEKQKTASDVNGDGNITVTDALQVLYVDSEIHKDFYIYQIEKPSELNIDNLGEYEFTISWKPQRYVIGYNVFLNGKKINGEMLTDNHVTIGGDNGDPTIAPKIHNSIDHNTEYNIEITAVNALKETEKSDCLTFKTKRAYSYVTFKDWDGTIIGKTQKVLYGQNAVMPNDPVRYGYVFTGWDTDATNVIEDLTITALYEDARYDYIFRDYDGKELYRQNIIHNGTVTPPADPKRTGYTFDGWYTQQSGGTKITDFSGVVSETTVYAQYNINTYTINYVSNGGTDVASNTAVYMTNAEAPAAPSRKGYSFSGWYKDESLTNKWDFSADVVTGDTTLYAAWKPVVITIDKPRASLYTYGSNTVQLSVSITGGTDTVTWVSSNPAVATVSSSGLVTAKGHGSCQVYAVGTDSNRSPACEITVVKEREAWVTGDGLAVRSQPSTSGAWLGKVNTGDKVTVYGEMTAQGSSGQTGWYYIRTSGGLTGYSSANYISFNKVTAPSQPTGDFAARIAHLKNVFPHNAYWNGGNRDTVTYTPCYNHDKCNYFNGGCQCWGFAERLFYGVYGHCTTQKIYTNNFNDIRIGDHIRIIEYGKNNEVYHHSVFVIGKNADSVTFAECNYGDTCQIKWGRVISRWNLNLVYIRR